MCICWYKTVQKITDILLDDLSAFTTTNVAIIMLIVVIVVTLVTTVSNITMVTVVMFVSMVTKIIPVSLFDRFTRNRLKCFTLQIFYNLFFSVVCRQAPNPKEGGSFLGYIMFEA